MDDGETRIAPGEWDGKWDDGREHSHCGAEVPAVVVDLSSGGRVVHTFNGEVPGREVAEPGFLAGADTVLDAGVVFGRYQIVSVAGPMAGGELPVQPIPAAREMRHVRDGNSGPPDPASIWRQRELPEHSIAGFGDHGSS